MKPMPVMEKQGPITPRKLAEIEYVSVPAISDWTKKWLEKGVICWTDKDGNVIENETELKKAKNRGDVYLATTGFIGLPTPFELTGDPDWDVEGALFKMHDLGVMEIEAVPAKSERDSVRDMLERQFEMECESKAHDQEVKKTLSKDLDLGASAVDNSGNEQDRVKELREKEDQKINFDDSDFDLGIDLKIQPKPVQFSGFSSEY